jgi:SAC3 family protein LENG8/THP3
MSTDRAHEKTRNKKRQKASNQANFVGTSTVLEKVYLRLTDYPKPENVRPLAILIKSLAHIKSHYIKNEDFDWANEQLKSVRQDLTVQNIRNAFSLNVYETHARLLIEHGDLSEFRQCQSMIQSLTSPTSLLDQSSDDTDDLGGDFQQHRNRNDEEILQQSEEVADEFCAYGILYNLVQTSWGELCRLLPTLQHKENGETNSNVSSANFGDIPSRCCGTSVRHALKVVKAVMHVDYQSFFRLYEWAPHLSAYMMDFLVRRVRKSAYQRIIASYRPSLSVEHFREALSFRDLEETRQFLKEHGALFIHELGAPPFWVDCKATALSIPRPSPGSDGRILPS